MSLQGKIVLTKGICFALDGFCAPIIIGLASWFNSETWPSNIVWVVIIVMAVKGGATSLGAFMSGSFADYLKAIQTNGKQDLTSSTNSKQTPTP